MKDMQDPFEQDQEAKLDLDELMAGTYEEAGYGK